MEPALTVEQWKRFSANNLMGDPQRWNEVTNEARYPTDHALAALCLYKQPFGFTWKDVDALKGYNYLYGATPPDLYYRAFESLAARIEALLPPRNP